MRSSTLRGSATRRRSGSQRPAARSRPTSRSASSPAGTYELLLSANGASTAFARLPLVHSAPYYVLVSTDWDFSDPGQQVITYQNQMHAGHGDLRSRTSSRPYTFTDPAVTARSPGRARRVARRATRLTRHRAESASTSIRIATSSRTPASRVSPISRPSTRPIRRATRSSSPRTTGRRWGVSSRTRWISSCSTAFPADDVPRGRLDRDARYLERARRPAHSHSSALNWARIEEWQGKELYRWIRSTGTRSATPASHIGPTPPTSCRATRRRCRSVEVPDNGVMIDYVSLSEMNGLFDANWDGQAARRAYHT